MVNDFNAHRRDVELLIDETLSDDAQRNVFVSFAGDQVEELETAWAQILGRRQPAEVAVDGRKGAPIESVNYPGGTVFARVQPVNDVIEEALRLADIFTKVRTGSFKRSLALFVNNSRTSRNTKVNPGERAFITFLADFAIVGEVREFTDRDDSGFSEGLIEELASLLRFQFRGFAVPIRYAWRTIAGRNLPGIAIG